MKLLIQLFLITAQLVSQTNQIEAIKIESNIEIDGIEEELWSQAKKYTNFTQTEPYPNKAASFETSFRFLYDNLNIYFFVHVFDEPDLVLAESGKRDNEFRNSDYVSISIDPLLDKRTGYRFSVNPSNLQRDERLFDNDDGDEKWNAIWYSATKRTENGWTIEVKIPLRDLKFQEIESQNWGFNIERRIRRLRETSYWKQVDPDLGFKVSEFAIIRNLVGLKSRNEINVIPSAVAIFDSESGYDPSRSNRVLGLDLRYNFDERHSILATIKPDFSQIEADEDQINISDYPTELDEKRPFFLEGNELYETPLDLYYSRRMARPQVGTKFFGSTGSFKYGLTIVNNDGLFEDENKNLLRSNENFVIPRIKYIQGSNLSLGYFGGFIDSELNKSGQLHSTDLSWRATDHIDFVTAYASTNIKGNSRQNEQFGFNIEYDTDAWEAEVSLHKISNDFELDLIGFPDPNNQAQTRARLQHLMRFENSSIREIRFESDISKSGTFDFSLPTTEFSTSIRIRQHLDYFGGISYGVGFDGVNGYFRNYKIDSLSQTHFFDNYGRFEGEDESGTSFNFFFDSDFSKAFGFFIKYEQERFKQTNIINLQNNIQIKPNDDILIRLEFSIKDVGKSDFLIEETIKKLNLKVNYSVLPNLFVRIFSQINTKNDQLSNNLIVNYEYIRGSFIYFAYNETGELSDDFKGGSFLKNYNLNRRTFSLKWTYSFYL